jgi:membrane protease YdiL (CAAX protease family)
MSTEPIRPDAIRAGARREPVAPVWHTILLIGLFAALGIFGWFVQRRPGIHPQPAPPQPLAPLYVQALMFEWVTLAWVWFGVHRRNVRLADLVGGQWTGARAVSQDALLAAGVWALWLGVLAAIKLVVGPGPADAFPFPTGPLEVSLWLGLSLSAGFCEEVVFRGYFQRQFAAFSGNGILAVFLQALVFGIGHLYEGARPAATIMLYGVLFGTVALWRRSLRPGMIAHAWSDIAARVLRIQI